MNTLRPTAWGVLVTGTGAELSYSGSSRASSAIMVPVNAPPRRGLHPAVWITPLVIVLTSALAMAAFVVFLFVALFGPWLLASLE
jgi:hypothetical protein